MRRRSRAWLLLVVGSWCAMRGQTVPIERVTPQQLEAWPQVGLDVRITNHDDAAEANVAAGQLTVREDGRVVVGATLMASDSEPQSVCLLLDTSGSTWNDRDAIHEVMGALIQDIPAQDEVCLLTFSSKAYLDAPLTMNRKALTDGLKFAKISGGSALLDALQATAMELEAHARFRSRAIVLVSDGGENASDSTKEQVQRVFAARGAPVLFALLTGSGGTPAGHEDIRPLLRLIEDSGGVAFKLRHGGDRSADVDTLLHMMAARYRLVYAAPKAAADGREHTVDVQLSKDLKKRKMSVSVSRSYYAPEP